MAQNNNNSIGDLTGGKSAASQTPAKKERPAQPPKRIVWSEFIKKLLLPASILFAAGGLFLVGYNGYQISLLAGGQEVAVSLGMSILIVIVGALMTVAGVFGLMKQRRFRKLMMAFGVLALVCAIIFLTACVKSGAVAVASGIVTIVLSVFFIIAVDGAFEMGLIRFFREMVGELKKLTWLSGKELASHTLAVLVFVLAMAALIYVLDLAFAQGFGALSSIEIG